MNKFLVSARTVAIASALTVTGAQATQAQTWWDPSFYALGPSVTVRYLGSSAGFYDIMQWFDMDFTDVVFTGTGVVDYLATGPGVTNMFTNKTRSAPVAGILGGTIAGPMTKSVVGATFTINGLTPGQEVIFGLFAQGPIGDNWLAQDANDFTYFSGPGRNVDSQYHLKVTGSGTGYTATGGWEDIATLPGFNPDYDFNDIMFSVEGVYMTPEPITMTLLGTGLVGIAAARRRRRNKD